jgi:hypothetical protein
MLKYRESVLAALRNEGHQVMEVPAIEINLVNAATNPSPSNPKSKIQNLKSDEEAQAETNSLSSAIAAVRDKNYQAECEAIAYAEDLSNSQYQILQKRLVKTPSQRRALRKHELKLRYGIPVTAQLVAKDDEGWYPKLLLHYFLTLGRDYLAQRDAAFARRLIDLGGGSIFLPDFNRSQLGATVGTMELLGIPVLLEDEGRKLRNTDEDLKTMAKLALSNRAAIKTTLGIGLAPNATSITIIRRLLDKIGYGIRCIGRESKRLNRVRVYQVVNPSDGRFEVFQQWLAFGSQLLEISDKRLYSSSRLVDSTARSADLGEEVKYVQLCLSFSE